MNRKNQILSAIVNHFVETAEPVGSKTIILTYRFNVSPATVRSDMANLESEGMIMQPHTSSGRVPTDKGYRYYVEELADFKTAQNLAEKNLKKLREQAKTHKAREKVQSAVELLSKATPNIAFATIPDSGTTFYMGIAKILRQPEFMEAPMIASRVMEVMENHDVFLKNIKTITINDDVQFFIGEENILGGIDSCSLLITKYKITGFEGAIGILGPKRMPYAYNSCILKEIRDLMESNEL